MTFNNDKLASSWSNILTAALLCFFIVLQSAHLSGARKREYEESAEQGRVDMRRNTALSALGRIYPHIEGR